MLIKPPLTIFLFPERHFGESKFGRSPPRPPPTTNSETKMEELLKSTFSAQEGKLASFPPVAQLRVVCRSSSSRFCSACLWLLLFLLFRRLPATLSKCVSSPRNGRSQSAALKTKEKYHS